MSDSDPPRPSAPPPWLRPDTHAAMQRAYEREVAAGHDPAAAAAAACAVLLARVAGPGSGTPFTEEASPGAAPVTPTDAAPSGDALPPGAASKRLDEADIADLVQALAYALRHDERGRPRKGGWDFAADLAAEHLAGHLRRANFVVLRRRPGVPHRAG